MKVAFEPAVVLALVVALTPACSHNPKPHTPEQVAAESTEEPPDASALAALDALDIDDAQREALTALRARMKQEVADTAAVREAFIDSLLGQIAAGQVDRDALAPQTKALVASLNATKPKLLDALNELHAILRPAQRKALVESIEKRREQSSGEAKEQFSRLSEQLDLGFGQKMGIASALRDRLGEQREAMDQIKTDLKAAAEAFVGDGFDAHRLELNQHLDLGQWVASIVTFAEVVVEQLDPIQHATLAAILERRLRRRG